MDFNLFWIQSKKFHKRKNNSNKQRNELIDKLIARERKTCLLCTAN